MLGNLRIRRKIQMNAESKVLRRQRAALVEQMHDLTNKTSFPDESAKRWKELDTQQKDLEQKIARAESAELDEEMRRVIPPPMPQVGESYNGFQQRSLPQQENFSESRDLQPFAKELDGKQYRDAFHTYLVGGEKMLNSGARNLLADLSAEVRTYSGLDTTTSGDAGGYVIPIGFQRELEVRLKAVGRMRANCRMLTTATGNTLDWPTMDDTGNTGEFLAESNPVSQLNPTFNQVQFQSFLASSKQVLLSVQLFQDSAFDVESVLAESFGIRIGRIVNSKYTNGTGSGEPQGLIYAIKNDAVPNVVNATGSNSNDGIVGNTEANSIGSDDLDNLIAALDAAYRPNAQFMMHYKTLDFLRKVKDKYGRPLWSAGLAADQPDTIYGFPYDWNTDMDQIGAGKYPVIFGDFSKHCIRDVGGITLTRYSELYMPQHMIGFQAWLRTDSRRLQQSAFSLLYNPLS
jgi:HK97 family phage major capsid protein